MAKKRVTFEVKTTGTVNSVYLWVERKNVTLRNNKGYLMLKPRTKEYDLVYLGRGRKSAAVEVIVTSAGSRLGEKKSTIGASGKTSKVVQFKVPAS